MKKNLMILAVAALAVFASCSDKKAARSVVGKDTTSVVGNEGTFPAADGSGIKTVLTIKADGTYQIEQDYIVQKDGHDEASGVFKVLDDNVLMLVRPSSGEHTFYKVKDDNNIVMTDSVGNEPEGETAKHYVLKKRK